MRGRKQDADILRPLIEFATRQPEFACELDLSTRQSCSQIGRSQLRTLFQSSNLGSIMTAFLPQHDPESDARVADLAVMRREYQYNHQYVSPLALANEVPLRDKFSIEWIVATGKRLLNVMRNLAEVEEIPELKKKHDSYRKCFNCLVDKSSLDIDAMLRTLQHAIEMHGSITRADSYDDFVKLFRTIRLPAIHRDYRDDDVFADLRLAGPNPVMLERLASLDDRLPVTDADFHATLPDDSLEAAAAEGRLYLADYQRLEQLEKSEFPTDKYAYAPLALFAVNKSTRKLVPIAIQCKQRPAEDNPIFTPQDGYNWLIAKTIAGMADGNIHEPVTHLARTHLFAEPFVLATLRHLSSRHPLNLLLRPHFEGTLHINNLAHKYLIAPQGGVDRLTAGTIGSVGKLAVDGLQSFSVSDNMLPDTFKQRGVDDPQLLPNYSYRDDSLLYWDAIWQWASDYLSIYYPSDREIREDYELQAWHRELGSSQGGALTGLGDTLPTRDRLVDIVTLVIFTCSVQHAAVNFPQYDLMSYAPNMPLAVYHPAPTSKTGATEKDFVNTLPPLEQAHLQLVLGYSLGTVHYSYLGRYCKDQFDDERVAKPLSRFQAKIKHIGHTIAERNKQRRPYKFLLPKGIPQSINI